MTPAEVRALSIPEYLAFAKMKRDDEKAIERANRKKRK